MGGDSVHWKKAWCIDASVGELALHKEHDQLVQELVSFERLLNFKIDSVKKEGHDGRSVRSDLLQVANASLQLTCDLLHAHVSSSGAENLLQRFLLNLSDLPASARIAQRTYIRPSSSDAAQTP